MSHCALMFHHFCDEKHPKGQGAISADQFEALIDKYEDRLLNATEWALRLLDGTLEEGQVCITLDDGLLCQYEIALPVLKKRNINAFWFPYTGAQDGIPDSLEIYRLFCTVKFDNVNQFHNAFDNQLAASPWAAEISEKLRKFDPTTYLKKYPFYSDSDRRFRYIRDQVLGRDRYRQTMNSLMEHLRFNQEEASKGLWMNTNQLKHLHGEGHIIGLHSHTHPTLIIRLPDEKQHWEYETNISWLKSNIGITPTCVAYPCGSYDESTLEFLTSKNITIGFISSMVNKVGKLEISRLDHVLA